MTLSLQDFALVREQLLALIESMSKRVVDSDAQTLACLTLDWVRVAGAGLNTTEMLLEDRKKR